MAIHRSSICCKVCYLENKSRKIYRRSSNAKSSHNQGMSSHIRSCRVSKKNARLFLDTFVTKSEKKPYGSKVSDRAAAAKDCVLVKIQKREIDAHIFF